MAVLLLGIVLPLVLLTQAYLALASLHQFVSGAAERREVSEVIRSSRPLLRSANDYALYSLISAERTNERVLINKQVMKTVVMQIGFAVISVGLMFVVLGINDGGGEGTFSTAALRIDFKTSSTGALLFVLGAAMATAGGVLKNDYRTVPIPNYIQISGGEGPGSGDELIQAYRSCRPLGGARAEECFMRVFERLYPEAMR